MTSPQIIQIGNQKELLESWCDFLTAAYDWQVFGTHTFKHSRRDCFEAVNAFKIWLFKCCGEMAVELGEARAIDRPRTAIDRATGQPHELLRRAYQGRWYRLWRNYSALVHPVSVVGVEKDDLGFVHLHSLLHFPPYYGEVSRRRLWEMWFKTVNGGMGAGRARFEPPRDGEKVASYVSKYVLKEGEIVLSDSFGTEPSVLLPSAENIA